jgi:hypothetical protein
MVEDESETASDLYEQKRMVALQGNMQGNREW